MNAVVNTPYERRPVTAKLQMQPASSYGTPGNPYDFSYRIAEMNAE